MPAHDVLLHRRARLAERTPPAGAVRPAAPGAAKCPGHVLGERRGELSCTGPPPRRGEVAVRLDGADRRAAAAVDAVSLERHPAPAGAARGGDSGRATRAAVAAR